MPWAEIRESYAELVKDRDAAAAMAASWKTFKETAVAARPPPYQLRAILKLLADIERDKPRAEIAILDHGCGTGLTLLYLFALGFRRIYGVNIAPE